MSATPISLQPVTDLLAALSRLNITPASLDLQWAHTDRERPQVSMWLRTRTDFERVTTDLGLKTKNAGGVRCRKFWTTADHPAPLIQCASFPHHDDYTTPKESR